MLISQITSAIIILVAIHGLAHAQPHDPLRYSTGRRVAECLAQGCVAFTAVLNDIGPATLPAGQDPERAIPTRKLNFTIVEWLYGPRDQADYAIEMIHSARPQLSRLSEGPWTAWEDLPLQPGTMAVIVRRHGPAKLPDKTDDGASHNEVVEAASDPDLISALRGAVAHRARFEAADVTVVETDPLVDRAADAFVAGYLVNWLTDEVGLADSDSAAHYLAWLLAKPLAGMAVYEVTDWLTSVFYRLSGSEQDEVTSALANAGSGSNQSVSVAALRSLIRLSDEKLVNLRPYLSRPVTEGLLENYGTLDPQHKSGAELRRQLGLER